MLGVFRTYLRRVNAQSQTIWLKHGKPVFQAAPYLQFCNEVIFPLFDCIDHVLRTPLVRKLKNTVLVSAFVFGGAGLGWFYYLAHQRGQRVKQLDPALVHQSGDALGWVLEKFVFRNDFISKMLADIIIKQVLANERMQFMLARSLGRVLVSPSIQSQVNHLVKVPVLHQNVFYNPEIQKMLARLVGDVLRNPEVQSLIVQQLLAFSRSETAETLVRNGAADGLRLPIVRKLFTAGVVDDTIYNKLTDKRLARQLDQQLTEFLQN